MEQTKYTVFVERDHDGGGFDCYYSGGGFAPAELQGLIEWVPVGLYTPVAWCVGHADLNAFDHALAESIAAGRVIELVDGQYVPRGVPVPSTTPTLDKLENEAEPQRAPKTIFPHWSDKPAQTDQPKVSASLSRRWARISSMSHMLGNGIKG